jgi:hypothetical protein
MERAVVRGAAALSLWAHIPLPCSRASPRPVAGDGATDMQARPPADAFIGYGGIVIRKAVQEGADWFVTDFAELITEIR